jgi:hypothetical protein
MLLTPGMISGESSRDPLMGAACVDCLGLMSILLDALRGGRILSLVAKLTQMQAIQER